jgi:hypothetical protein
MCVRCIDFVSVSMKLYDKKFFVFILIINMLHECSEVYLDVWISQWANDHTASVNGTVDKGHNMRLVVYNINVIVNTTENKQHKRK